MRSPKRPNSSDEGVSATIGTIMALMVFMFLFGMIQTQYVPVAMKDTEANHMHNLEFQFTSLKQTVSNLIRTDAVNDTAYNPITLGSEGIPVFAQPTPGFLTFDATEEMVNVTFMVHTNVSGTINTEKIYGNTSGYLSVYVPNRYYTPGGYVYSCGSVLLYQPSGSVMIANPPFSIINKSGDIGADIRTIKLVGETISQAGTGTVSVHSSFIYTYENSYMVSNSSQFMNSTLWINLTTRYPEAWEEWFQNTLTQNGLRNGTDFTITKTLRNSNVYPEKYSLSVRINDVKIFSMRRSLVEIVVGET